MNFNKIYFLFLLFPISAMAQQEVPISQNAYLQSYHAAQERLLPENQRYQTDDLAALRRPCSVEEAGLSYVNTGTTIQIDVDIEPVETDTLPTNLVCENCNEATFGTASINADGELEYVANPGIEGATESITVSICNSIGCNSQEFPIVIRRPGTTHILPTVSLEAEERHVETLDASLLPGELICNTIIECEDNYEGREQKFFFSTYNQPDNVVIYSAGRFGGTDIACAVLCDNFAVCDTFMLSFDIAKQPTSLPFMDDFSYDGPRTDPNLWLNSEVYVNDQMGIQPPSFGVATFDGVDERGRPYGGGYGPADQLTSNYIDLSAETDTVFLTYWVQKKGLGNLPELQDSLVIQLRRDDGEWVTVRNLPGAGGNDNDFTFYRQTLPPAFVHGETQFRFVNYSNRTGILDQWHVDYVRMSNRRQDTDTTFTDIAFTRRPNVILENYTSMPWIHFKGIEEAELSTDLPVGLYNHAVETLNGNPSNVRLTETVTNTSLFSPVPTLFNGTEANIESGLPLERSYSLTGGQGFPNVFNDYLNTMESNVFDGFDRLEFVLEYNLSNNTQVNQAGFEAVERNDQVSRTTVFDNYFAYDDGTAESSIIASFRDQIAVQFTANASGDSLRAIQFHFPHTTIDVSDQLFNIQVWFGELDETPEYEALLQTPYYADNFLDTLQGFTSYPLVDEEGNFAPLELPEGNFFVGWEQASTCEDTQCIPVGYDKNNPNAQQFLFLNVGFGWEELPNVLEGGALMIRPVVGSVTPGFTSTEEVLLEENIQVFPNPTTGVLNVLATNGVEEYNFQLFNAIGQLVQQGQLQPQLHLQTAEAGVYYLKIINKRSNHIVNKKVILTD